MNSSQSNFLKSLCNFSLEGEVWFYLWENGPTRYTDILAFACCSRSKLSNVLQDLKRANLVTLSSRLYEAVVPDWLTRDD